MLNFKNHYALITGAAKGLGKSYAFNLAKHGLSGLMLNDFAHKELLEVKKELEELHPGC